jgi:hypothetical protein
MQVLPYENSHMKLSSESEPKPKGYLADKTKLTLIIVGFEFFHSNSNPQKERAKMQ